MTYRLKLICTGVAMILECTIMLGILWLMGSHPKTVTVDYVYGDQVFVVDEYGECYSFYGDGFAKGDVIKAVFDGDRLVDIVEE